MRITFLGTGAGFPTKDRHCASCLIEIGERLYLIDAGVPVTDIFAEKEKSIENIRGVFLSHFHLDHSAGCIQLMDLAMNYYRKSEFVLYVPEQRAIDAVKAVIAASGAKNESDRVGFSVYDENFVFDDGTLKLVPIRTHHTSNNPASGINSFAYYIEAEGKRLLFTNDLSMYHEANDFPKIVNEGHFDLVVSECGHITVENLVDSVKDADIGILAVTHVGIREHYEKLEEIKNQFAFEMIIAKDNDYIEL